VSLADLVTLERDDPAAEVLMVTSGWPNPDNETYCVFIKRQVESLVERGLRCDVLFIRGYRSPLAYLVGALRLAAWSMTRKRRYRIVHAHGGEAALAASFYRRAPLLVSYMGDDLLGTPDAVGVVHLASKARRRLLRAHARTTRRTITKSQQMADVLPRKLRARNMVIPNGVDTTVFRPVDRTQARDELGWDPEAPIALFAADPAVPRKRYRLAESAVERARHELPMLQLHVATRVSPERIPLLMSAADCLLLTSSIEGSPNVVKEALMCNLPVISTEVGDVAELLDDVTPSYICAASEASLAQAVVSCLREPRRSNGRARSTRLDAQVIADLLLELYREIAPVTVGPIG
jgi:teichuronic acid biosynthesis glycosyltransferase TuaC